MLDFQLSISGSFIEFAAEIRADSAKACPKAVASCNCSNGRLRTETRLRSGFICIATLCIAEIVMNGDKAHTDFLSLFRAELGMQLA
jgi:hypothetical protein